MLQVIADLLCNKIDISLLIISKELTRASDVRRGGEREGRKRSGDVGSLVGCLKNGKTDF